MFWLFEEAEQAAEAEQPIIVQIVNHYLGPFFHNLEMTYTYPLWQKFFAYFGTTPEEAFGPYTVENAIPWYTVMFFIACILSVVIIWILKGKLSHDRPGPGQQTLEIGMLAVEDLLHDVVGPHGLKYFPVVMTFAVLILVSNLMGLFPLFLAPTSATSVTFALGLSSFLYYNYIGIKENGIFGHLKHFAGPIWWIAPLIFPIELVSNLIRPFSLGIRLFGNLFADEKVMETLAHLAPPYTYFAPIPLMVLSVFVALIQTFVFVLLSQLYLSEVSHAPHDSHAEHNSAEDLSEEFIVPVLT